jgi:alkylhydroperoxidase family enzyme
LRELGFSDRAILEINLAAAYMNFVNRIAQGLGVELEASMQGFTR